jgi:hypothetical protein
MNFLTVPRLALVSIVIIHSSIYHRDVKKIECVIDNDASNNIAVSVTVTTHYGRPNHSEQQAVACCR